MRSFRCSARTLLLSALLLAMPALAGSLAAPWTTISQVRMGTTMGIVTTLQMKQRLEKRGTNGGTPQAALAAAPVQAGDLVVASNPAVTAQARQAFIGGLSRNSGKAVADEADRLFGNVQTTFARMVAPYGLRSDDFADVMTAYMIVMWMSVNQQTELPQRSQVQAVRSQMRNSFVSAAGKVSDARQRQLMAEAVMYQTCMAVAIREQAQAQSKPELLSSLASAINQNMSTGGISLASMALTDQGLVRR
ncbi:MAG: DUF6683 family protein [Dokdonella sp.]